MTKITFLILLLAAGLSAQTRLISHKSHSGSTATFHTALENNLFDIGESNLGRAPQRRVVTAQLDSVIFIGPGKAVMVTSQYCRLAENNDDDSESPKKLWRAGRDTVYNHPLFSRRHSLDSIRLALKKEYYFKNNIDSTVFVGYDNKVRKYRQEKKKAKSLVPVVIGDDTAFPSAPVLVLVLALLSATLSFMLYLRQKATAKLLP